MARRPLPLRKRRTREHVIADLGINHVERQALLAGYVVERSLHDYGLDLVLWTFSPEGEVEAGGVSFQVKATEHLKWSRDKRFISFRIQRADLRNWLVHPFPVILAVYDVPNDRAYWFYVQSAFTGVRLFRAALGSESLTIHRRAPLSRVSARIANLSFWLDRRTIKIARNLRFENRGDERKTITSKSTKIKP